MSMLTPLYARRVVLAQSVMVILFAIALFFFLYLMEQEKRINQELAALATQRQEIEQVQKNIALYEKMLAEDIVLQTIGYELRWEQVEFHWQSIQFSALLARLESLDQQERIFVLESFESKIKRRDHDERMTAASPLSEDDRAVTEPRSHYLRGYFLCPGQ